MRKKSLKINFIFNTIKTIMIYVFPVISFPYISRVLGVSGVGCVQYSTSVITYFVLFSNLGINTYAIREGTRFRNDKVRFSIFVKELFTINMITTMVAYLVLAMSLLCGAFEGKQSVIIVSSLAIIANTIGFDWIFQVMEDYVYISIRSMLLQLIAFIAMLLLVKSEKDILLYALIYVMANRGHCFFNLYKLPKYIDFKIKCKLSLQRHIKPILIIFGVSLATSIYTNMDVVMLGILCDDYHVGLYSAAVKINKVVKDVIVSISVVILPQLVVYLSQGNKQKFEELFKKGADLNMFFSIASAVGLFVLSKPIIILFSGSEFEPAVLASKILAVRLVFSALDNIFYNQVLIPSEKEKESCIGTALGALTNLVLNLLLIPIFKVEGAAIATVLSEGIVFVFFIIITRKIINLKYVLADSYKYAIAASVMGIVIWCGMKMINSMVFQILILIPLGATVYFSVLGIINRNFFINLLDKKSV